MFSPGFEATFNFTRKNQGLIQMANLTLTGQQDTRRRFTPRITYCRTCFRNRAWIFLPRQLTRESNAPRAAGTGQCAGRFSCRIRWLSLGDIGTLHGRTAGHRQCRRPFARRINTFVAAGGGAVAADDEDLRRRHEWGVLPAWPEQIASYIGCVIGHAAGRPCAPARRRRPRRDPARVSNQSSMVGFAPDTLC